MDETMSQSAAARAYDLDPSGQDEASAWDRIVPRREPIPDQPAGGPTPEESLDEARFDWVIRVLPYLSELTTRISEIVAERKWSSTDALEIGAAIGSALSSVHTNLDAAQAAINAWAGLAVDTVAIEREPEPEAQPAMAAEPAPETWLPLPAEGYLVAATRAAEAVRSHAEQALMGFQFAPRETGMIFGVLDAIQEHAEAAQRHYLDFTLAQDAEARAR